MKKSKILLLTIAIILIMGLVLTGCGKKDQGSADEGSKGVKLIDVSLTEEEYAFGVDKNQPELLTKVNEFIAKIQSDGTFEEISNNYFG